MRALGKRDLVHATSVAVRHKDKKLKNGSHSRVGGKGFHGCVEVVVVVVGAHPLLGVPAYRLLN